MDFDFGLCISPEELLLEACKDGWLESAMYTVEDSEYRADASWANKKGDTAFLCACREGHLAVAKWLYEWVPESRGTVAQPAGDGCTPFFEACALGHLKIAQWMFECVPEAQSTFNQPSNTGYTPFQAACTSPTIVNLELAKWLHASVPAVRDSLPEANLEGKTLFATVCGYGFDTLIDVAVWLASLPSVYPEVQMLHAEAIGAANDPTSDSDTTKMWAALQPRVIALKARRATQLAQLLRQDFWNRRAGSADSSVLEAPDAVNAQAGSIEAHDVVARIGLPVFHDVMDMLAPRTFV